MKYVGKIEFVFYVIMVPAYGFIKLSVIFFYRHISVKGTNSRFDKVTKISIAIVILRTITFFLAEVFACGPQVLRNCDPLIEAAHYADGDKIVNGLFVSDFLTDFLVLTLPILVVGNDLVEVIQHLILNAAPIDCKAKNVNNVEAQRRRCTNAWSYLSIISKSRSHINRHIPGPFVQPLSGWFSTSKLPRRVWPKRQTSMVGLHHILIHTLRLTSDIPFPQRISQRSYIGECSKLAFP